MGITINLKPLPKQYEAWKLLTDKITKYLLFGGGAGGGKSWFLAEWLVYSCYVYPGTKWFIGRNELKRLMSSTYETFLKVCKYHKIPDSDWKLNQQYNYVKFVNGSKIDLLDVAYSPSDPMYERFGSTEYTGGAIDEASEIELMAFDVLKSRIGRHMNSEYGLAPKLLLTANPKKNWLKRMIVTPWKQGTLDPKYAFVPALYTDNTYTSKEYGDNLNEITDRILKQRLKDGNWDYDEDDDSLINGNAIQDIWTNVLEWTPERFATLDVARFGKDSTRLYVWQGWNVSEVHVWEHQDTAVTAEKVKIILQKNQIPRSRLIVDEVGLGGGVMDNIRGCRGFIANSSPMENPNAKPQKVLKNGELREVTPRENFATLKDQCGYYLAERINDRKVGADITDEGHRQRIEDELAQLKDAQPDGDGKKRLVPKDKIKEVIGRSPDDLDNFIMRVAFDLLPPKPESNYADEARVRENRNSRERDSLLP
jgi:hypothetical protein